MFQDFKPVLRILAIFIGIYLVLTFLYQMYLNTQDGLDSVSMWVARQVIAVQEMLGYPSSLQPVQEMKTAFFGISGIFPTRMVEGCNAVSVMILFVAFVLAFYKGKKTLAFCLIGLVIMHIMNVLRIAGLNIVYINAPDRFKMAHDYLFPAVIYGTVVVLWLIWIKFFALKNHASY